MEPAHPVADQEDLVRLFGVRTSGDHARLPPQLPVVFCGGALIGQDLIPPAHHALVLGEEAVPADVDPLVVVMDRLGDAADGISRLQDRHIIAFSDQLQACSQAGGACADDDCSFHFASPCSRKAAISFFAKMNVEFAEY